jgi:hypothetical protein
MDISTKLDLMEMQLEGQIGPTALALMHSDMDATAAEQTPLHSDTLRKPT